MRTILVAGVAFFAAAAPAAAQSGAPADAPSGAAVADQQLQDIVVTAERRAESLQKTPVAVSAFDQGMLDDRQVLSVVELGRQVPSLVLTPTTGINTGARIFLRGIGEDNAVALDDPAVGTYLDGIYVARINGAQFDFNDIERLEVLRGPQGTLYGRNTAAGAVKIITKDPTFDFRADADVTVGNLGRIDARGTVSGTLIPDLLAGSVSLISRNRDGYVHDTTLGKDVEDQNTKGARVGLLFTPAENLKFVLRGDYVLDESGPGYPSSIAANPSRDIYTTESASVDKSSAKQGGISLISTWTPGAWTITSITGYRELHNPVHVDSDGQEAVLSELYLNLREKQFSQELTVARDWGFLHTISGLFFFDENSKADQVSYTGFPAIHTVFRTPNRYEQQSYSKAAFGEATADLPFGFHLTGGLRYSWEQKSFKDDYYEDNFKGGGTKSWSALTPKLSLNYNVTDDAMTYVSYTQGFQSGGWNTSSNHAVDDTPYNQEKTATVELGAKLELLDRTLRLNGDYFRTQYDGMQLSVFDSVTGTSRRLNVPQARVNGFELESTYVGIRDLELYGSLSTLDGFYTKYFQCLDPNPGSPTENKIVDCSHKDLKGLAPFQGTIGATYSPTIARLPGQLHANVDFAYADRNYNNVANSETVQTGAHRLLSASVGYDLPGGHWSVVLAGKNILNDRYVLSGLNIDIPGLFHSIAVYPAEPATVTLTLRYRQ